MDAVEGLQEEHRRPPFSSGWRAFKHLTTLGYPRRFPVVQFPNLPLIIALVAGHTSRYFGGVGHAYVLAVAYLAMTIWAYEELARGTNWFRRLLGVAFAVILVVTCRGWIAQLTGRPVTPSKSCGEPNVDGSGPAHPERAEGRRIRPSPLGS